MSFLPFCRLSIIIRMGMDLFFWFSLENGWDIPGLIPGILGIVGGSESAFCEILFSVIFVFLFVCDVGMYRYNKFVVVWVFGLL
jgi:hypothetical protein